MDDILDHHPNAQALSAFGLGQLTGGAARDVERHLAVCPECRSTVDDVPADSFVTLLRAARQATEPPATPSTLRATVADGTPVPTAAGSLPPALADHPRYRVRELLGVGGMGAVYRAEHQLMERAVALKVINHSLTDNPGMVERFRREVKAAARLVHPNIVTAYDADQADDTHFLVMEYVEGLSLARLVAEQGRLPVAQACDCVRQAARGLQHAFEKGMVHRDIKPQNLMRTPDGQVKILDFGLARFAMETTPAGALLAETVPPAVGESLTQVGAVIGTPDYIAPEQAHDAHSADIRADIYSLGCTLYDLLAGQAPFPEGTAVQKVLAHVQRTPRPLTELRPDVPPTLVRVVERMMAKEPERRYQTPAEVAEALAPFVTPPQPAAGRPRRRWMLAAAAALLLMGLGTLVGLIAGFSVAFIQPNRENAPSSEFAVVEKADTGRRAAPPRPPNRAKATPVLALDTGGHTAPVVRALFTRDSGQLITVALDNSIRFWDVAGGKSLRVLRPPLGPDQVGRLTAAALSPDGSLLAVGGHTTPDQDVARGVVYLIALPSGRLERVLTPEQPSGLRALAFSPKGDRLVSTAANQAVVWDVKTGRPDHVLIGHQGDITEVAFAPDGRLATASQDRTVRLWSAIADHETTLEHPLPVTSVAWSPDGKTIAAAGSGESCVSLWAADGTGQQQLSPKVLNLPPSGKVWIGSLNFTADSRELLVSWGVGLAADDYAERGGSFLNLATLQCRPGFRGRGYFRGVRGALSADGQLAVTTGGNDHDVALWRSGDGGVVHRLAGEGRTPLRVGWKPNGWVVGWGHADAEGAVVKDQPLQRAFDLAAGRFEPQPEFAVFQREQSRRGELSLEIPPDGAYAAVRWEKANRTSISWNPGGGKWGLDAVVPVEYRRLVRCGTALPGARVLLAGDLGLYVHNVLKGSRDDHFWQGSGDAAWSVAPGADGRYVVAAHADQTLRVWDPAGEQPLLSLFAAGPEWVVWTPEGYYAASPGGERFLGRQLSEGPAALCSFVGIAQFRKSLHRPDVIRRVLETGSVARAVQMADKDAGRPTQSVAADRLLPPQVILLAPGQNRLTVQEPRFVLRAAAQGVGQNPLKTMHLLLNGRPCTAPYESRLVSASTTTPLKMEMEWTVTLPPGTHQLAVLARGERSDAVSEAVEVTCTPPRPTQEGRANLRVLAVGINDYADPSMRLTWAGNDARELAQTFEAHSKPLFGKVETRVVLDKEATRQGVLEGLDWLQKQTRPQDVAVIFYAGRGARGDEGDFLLLPRDVDPKRLGDTSVTGAELRQRLTRIPGRVLVLLDACHSGAVARRGPQDGLARDKLVADLADEDRGAFVMTAARSQEEARENASQKHGLFTLALIEGLSGKGTVNKYDGKVYVHDLYQHAFFRVQKLSDGKQTPSLLTPWGAKPFALSKP